jgi:hypothetical protein
MRMTPVINVINACGQQARMLFPCKPLQRPFGQLLKLEPTQVLNHPHAPLDGRLVVYTIIRLGCKSLTVAEISCLFAYSIH